MSGEPGGKEVNMEKIMLELWDLHKIYSIEKSGVKYEALKGVDFQAKEGDFIAIMGESGSGKTTTLNIIASLDTPTSGEVVNLYEVPSSPSFTSLPVSVILIILESSKSAIVST